MLFTRGELGDDLKVGQEQELKWYFLINLSVFGCAGSLLLCGFSLVEVRGHLIVVASLAAEHRLQGACGLRTCGSETGLIG